MSKAAKKSISFALVGVIVAMLGFLGVQTQTCQARINTLIERTEKLEDLSQDLQEKKAASDLILVKLNFEMSQKLNKLNIIEEFIDAIPLPMWIKRIEDDKIKMVFINRAYENEYNISKARYIGATDDEIWPYELAKKFEAADRKVLEKKGAIRSFEEVVRNDQREKITVIKFYMNSNDVEKIGGIVAC